MLTRKLGLARRQSQRGAQGLNVSEFLSLRVPPQLEQPLAAGAHHAFVAASGVIEGGIGFLQAAPDSLEVLGELAHPGVELLRGLGNLLGAFGLRVLLPTDTDGTE